MTITDALVHTCQLGIYVVLVYLLQRRMNRMDRQLALERQAAIDEVKRTADALAIEAARLAAELGRETSLQHEETTAKIDLVKTSVDETSAAVHRIEGGAVKIEHTASDGSISTTTVAKTQQ